MTRTNLVDAYDNRSVVAKLVSMEERISGAETSVEASAEAAASSASAAAASQTAAKASETSAKASADTAAATLSNTVDLTSKQTVTGAKTFAGDTAVTGSFVTSGNAEMAKLDIDTGKLTVGSGGSAEINGPLTASNASNTLKVADHDSVLTGSDVLSAKDIMTANGSANNLMHRSGEAELITSRKNFLSEAFQIEMTEGQTECRQYMKINLARDDITSINQVMIILRDVNDQDWGFLQFIKFDDGRRTMQMTFLDNNGGQHAKTLFSIDKDGNIIG